MDKQERADMYVCVCVQRYMYIHVDMGMGKKRQNKLTAPAMDHTGSHIFIQDSTRTDIVQEIQEVIWRSGHTKVWPSCIVEMED